MKMNYYDFKKAEKILKEEIKKGALSAEVGMGADWNYTAMPYWEKGKKKKFKQGDKVAGIDASYWAVPVMKVEYKDGFFKEFEISKTKNVKDVKDVKTTNGGLVITEWLK